MLLSIRRRNLTWCQNLPNPIASSIQSWEKTEKGPVLVKCHKLFPPRRYPPKMDLTETVAGNWKTLKLMWNNYEVASRLRTQSNELWSAIFLTCIGPDVLDIYDGLPFDNDEEKTDIERNTSLVKQT